MATLPLTGSPSPEVVNEHIALITPWVWRSEALRLTGANAGKFQL